MESHEARPTTSATKRQTTSLLAKHLAVTGLLLLCGVTVAMKADRGEQLFPDEPSTALIRAPEGVRLFDLHDPLLASSWPNFLATTPMANQQGLPPSLQSRLASLVGIYRSLTPVGEPAYFVATYFDVLSESLLSADIPRENGVQPLQVCPVFISGGDAPVSRLLAATSGLSDELFVNAPGQRDRYHYLFLQTEFSHCRFLTSASAIDRGLGRLQPGHHSGPAAPNIAFSIGPRDFRAYAGSRDELRAIIETVGEIDAIRSFRQRWPESGSADEADVLRFVRLLSLLATDSKNGYAAIPVLFPLLNAAGEQPGPSGALEIAAAFDLAYGLRATFREFVPFTIRNTDDLLSAKQSVLRALEGVPTGGPVDWQVQDLLRQFVTGSDLLLDAGPG